MTRIERILKYIDKKSFGLEVAPYFNPSASKRDGFNVLILDVFDTQTLRRRAEEDPHIANERIGEIEEVDMVGSATEIRGLVERKGVLGNLDFIISSHNFEHLANPIKFLQGCHDALKAGGMLSMAVPDVRACFDHYRFPTTLADWLEAYFTNLERPTPKQVFEDLSLRSYYHPHGTGEPATGCNPERDTPEYFRPEETLEECYARWQAELKNPSPDYTDSHCSTFFNHSLELMLRDLQFLKLIKFDIVEISETVGHEFFVHLKKAENNQVLAKEDFYKKRREILRKMNQSLGWAGYKAWQKAVQEHNFDNTAFIPPLRRTKKSLRRRISAELRRWVS